MKYIFSFLIILIFSFKVSSQSNIEKDDLLGCWIFVDYVDSTTFKELKMKEIFEHDIQFSDIKFYKTKTREGSWELDGNELTIYKNKFTDDEKEMAAYFKQSPKEATRIVYPELQLKNNFLYYLIYSEAEPFVMYAKLKKAKCL